MRFACVVGIVASVVGIVGSVLSRNFTAAIWAFNSGVFALGALLTSEKSHG